MEKEIKTLFEKNTIYSPKEISEILKINKKTIISAVKSGQLIGNNISLGEIRVNYRITGENILAWLDNYSDLEVLEKFLEFYVDSNGFEKTKEFINNYFDNKEKNDIMNSFTTFNVGSKRCGKYVSGKGYKTN